MTYKWNGTPEEPKQLKPCGTNAAWVRHRKHGEKPCYPCRIAHAEYMRAYMAEARAKGKYRGRPKRPTSLEHERAAVAALTRHQEARHAAELAGMTLKWAS